MEMQLTNKEALEYLDNAIRYWRSVKDARGHLDEDLAVYYIDAFQSVRLSLFGELLPNG